MHVRNVGFTGNTALVAGVCLRRQCLRGPGAQLWYRLVVVLHHHAAAATAAATSAAAAPTASRNAFVPHVRRGCAAAASSALQLVALGNGEAKVETSPGKAAGLCIPGEILGRRYAVAVAGMLSILGLPIFLFLVILGFLAFPCVLVLPVLRWGGWAWVTYETCAARHGSGCAVFPLGQRRLPNWSPGG